MRREGVEIWGYCLMPNHTHLIAFPVQEESLRRAIGEAHRRYTRRINFREKWRGYLWQGRFASFVMDEPYLLAAARYVELNPVRARLVGSAAEWPWSSARRTCRGVTTAWSRSARCWRWLAIGRLARQCFAGRGTGRVAWARPNRAPAGRRDVSGTFGGHGRPCPEAPEGRSEAQTAQTTEMSNVSPDFRSTSHRSITSSSVPGRL